MRFRPRKSHCLSVLACVAFLLLFAGPLQALPPGGGGHGAPVYAPHVPGEILIKFRKTAGPSEHANARAAVSGTRLRQFRSGAEHWKTGPGVSTEEAIARLHGNPHVEYVEPNYIVTTTTSPNDPSYPLDWGLHNTGQTGGTPGADIDAEAAWDLTTGSRDVIVGVIDTGIDYNHPDLAANIWTNPGEIPGNHIDDDHNGYVDDVHGWDFVNNDNDPFDDHFHGTHVAGTIGAVGNNGIGIAGVNWRVSLVPLKFLSSSGSGSISNAVLAVDYATMMHFDMTSNSWGGGGFSQALLDAINAAGAANQLFIAAAGNSNTDIDLNPFFPAGYDAPNLVSVAATDDRDGRASFSNFGRLSVDLGAPGVNVFSAAPGGAYQYLSGTSMATPHVAGVAALLRAVSPGLPVAAVKRALLDSADRIPSLAGITVSGGRLNAVRALASLDSVPPDSITDLAASNPTSSTVTLSFTATGDDGPTGTAALYDVRFATTPIDASSFAAASRATGAPAPQPAGSAERMEVAGLVSGTTYYFAVEAVDDGGNSGPVSNTVFATTLPPPTFFSTPSEFSLSLFTGQSATRTLMIENIGTGTLDWSIPTPSVLGAAATPQASMTLAKGQPDPRSGAPVTEGAGGPDSFGYRFIDSDETGGPAFAWNDISTTGTVISSLTGDDVTSGPISLGFDFPFYGSTFNAVHVSTNGFLSFTNGTAPYTNQPLPNAGAPENLIAPFWDDLVFRSASRAVYASDGTSFTIQYVAVGFYSGSGTVDFEVTLRNTGEILFQYLSMVGSLDSATVGIQDGTKTVGLQATFNAAYLHDGLAVRFEKIPQWLLAAPTSGRVLGGDQQDVTLTVDAAGLRGGVYQGSVIVQTNDPMNVAVTHPVTLTVTDAPTLLLAPSSLNFGQAFLGFGTNLLLTVSNTGTADLTVGLTPGDPEVTLSVSTLTVPPRAIAQVGVILLPQALGDFTSTLTVVSNAPNAPLVEVPISATVVPAPGIQVEPSSYVESLLTGGRVSRNLRVTNTGGSDLVLSLTSELLPSSPPPVPGPTQGIPVPTIVNGGFELGTFQGWTTSTNGRSELIPWSVSTAGRDYFGVSSPSEGRFYAVNGFDGESGLAYDLYQDLSIPGGTIRADLHFDDRIQFDSLGNPSTLPRIYEATIEDPNGAQLALVVHEEILLNGRTFTDTGWRHRLVALAPFAGRTVRLHLHESIPESFTGPGSIEFDAFAIDAQTIADWLAVAPAMGTIPPGGSQDFTVTFDADDSDTAVYTGAVRLETNIPSVPTVRVPATLSVIGAPNIGVEGQPVTLESVQTYAGSGAATSHTLTVTVPPAGDGHLDLIANGDYGDPPEMATAIAEGITLGSAGATGFDCTPATGTFPIAAADLASLAADGVVHVDVRNSPQVDAFCTTNSHTVRLTYNGRADHLDFGTIFVGVSLTRSLVIRNDGSDFLHVTSIGGGLAEFTPSLTSATLAPRTSRTLTVRFAPSAEAAFADTLLIASDDPDSPLLSIPMSGAGLLPPIVGAHPASLSSTLPAGQSETQTLTLTNTGGSPLNFDLRIRRQPGSTTSCEPTTAVVSEFSGQSLSTVDLTTGAIRRFATGLNYPNKGLAVYAGETAVLVTESVGDTVATVDLASGAVRRVATGFDFPNGLALNAAETTAFVTESSRGTVTAVDLATGAKTTVASGLSTPNQIVLDSTESTAYVAEYGSGEISSVDMATGTVRRIAFGLIGPNSLVLDSTETKAWVSESSSGRISEVDLATGTFRTVATGLGEIGSLAVDPADTTLFATRYSSGQLAAVDLATGAVRTIASGLTGPVGVDFLLPAGCNGGFLSLNPASGSVPAYGSLDVLALFDASSLLGGRYLADIDINSNDPLTPTLTVPAMLTVIGEPDIAITGRTVTLESARDYTSSGAVTAHTLAIGTPPAGQGRIDVIADGQFGFSGHTATATAEGLTLGTVGGTSGLDCTPAQGSFPVSSSDLASLVADGEVAVTVQNSSFVGAICPVNRHTVRLTYEGIAERLEFGPAFTGTSRGLSITIKNTGTDVLQVASILSDDPAFAPSFPSLVLAPRSSRVLTVTFAPQTVASFSGTLTIVSNDPDTPVISISMTGAGVPPPVVGVSPTALLSTLLSGDQETQTLTVLNTGGSPLDFLLTIAAPSGRVLSAPFTGLSPTGPGVSNNPPPPRDDFSDPPSRGGGRRRGESDGSEDPGATSAGSGSVLGMPGDFDRLSSSPARMTCVAEDPVAGFVYAQANSGTTYYRYRAAADTWERLADAPIFSGNNGGAALLNGKIYTAYTGSASLGVYDIASNAWSVISSPLGIGTGNIGTDGTRFLYLVVNFTFVRLDPVTSRTTYLAAPPFSFQAWGGIRWLSGILYAHQGNGTTGFVSYDIPSDHWTFLPPIPSGGVLGAAIDPLKRDYYAYGSYGGTNLYRYSIDSRVWSVSTIPFFSVNDGGMGWMPLPVAGIYFVEGESGTGFARLVTDPGFLRLSPASGTVPPFGSFDVSATFDAANRVGGRYSADILLSSNDPVTPLLTVPADLTVIGVPNIELRGVPVSVASTLSFSASGARTSHTLPIAAMPAGGGTFTLVADGEFGSFSQTATATAEGVNLGTVGGAGPFCGTASGSFPVSASVLAALTADGVVHVDVQNSPGVDAACSVNDHMVRFSYTTAADRLDFGSTFVGAAKTLSFIVANSGSDVLHVASIASSTPEFSPSVASMDLDPGASRTVSVTFTPPSAASFAGTLSLASDDPDAPLSSVALTGIGLLAPVVGVQPPSLDSTLAAGDTETRTLTISNSGGSPLEYSLTLRAHSTSGAGHVLGAVGTFDPLAASPTALTCFVEDRSSGFIYAQADEGVSFYRYSAALNSWTALAGSPLFSGNNGGAALLNGKIYTTYTGLFSSLGVYDVAANSWSTIPNPLGAGTGNIASDGAQFLYLVVGSTFRRLDPVTGITTSLAPPPFSFEPWGGLRFLGGVLYGHQGNGNVGFASYNVAANAWSTLPSLPDGAVLGATIDPVDRKYYAYGSYFETNLYKYDIDARSWSASTIPFFSVNDGGMGWLPFPVSGVYFVQGESGTGFARLVTLPEFLSVSPTSGSVPPSGSQDVSVVFDATTLPPGSYAGDIDVTSNDPVTPVLTVPASLTILGVPNMVITAAPTTVQSIHAFSTAGALTSHILQLTGAPAGDGTLDLFADGNFESAAQTATLSAGGSPIGTVGATGMPCGRASGSFNISRSQLESLATDGILNLEVQNSSAVGASCMLSQHTIRLTYPIASDHLDFGTQLAGLVRTLTLNIANVGTDVLHMTSIATDRPEFTVSAPSLDVPPGGAQTLSVTLASPPTGALSGVLTIESNDVHNPHLTIPLSGTVLALPVAGVQPTSLSLVLTPGEIGSQTLTLSNTGGGPLHFALNTSALHQAAFLSTSPTSGIVPPSGSVAITVVFDARTLFVGPYSGSILVSSDDPAAPMVTVPVSLRVTGVPAIALSAGTITIESSASFVTTGGRTTQAITLPSIPTGNGTLEVIAEGNFQAPVQTATVTIEGFTIGSLGGPGAACGTVSSTFPLSASLFRFFSGDGVVNVNVQNSANVGVFCSPSSHTLRLSYHQPLAAMDLGQVFVGGSSSLSFYVENAGDDVLHVSSITSDRPVFTVSSPGLTLPPGEVGSLTVTYTPVSEGSDTGALTFLSDDPIHPQTTLPLTGVGARPPIIGVTPGSLSSRLRVPAHDTQTLTISNSGSLPLSFSLGTRAASFVTFSPASGIVPSSGSMTVNVIFDGSSQFPGPHSNFIDVTSNDPLTPVVSIPISIYVLGTPSIALEGSPIAVSIPRTYTAAGARTTHFFFFTPPPAEGADVEVTVEGDYGDLNETATADAEALRSVIVGGVGGACVSATGGFSLSAFELRNLLADGSLRVTVQNTAQVDASCPLNRHTVRVTYAPMVDELDFSPLFTGATASLPLFISNHGTDDLNVTSIAGDLPEFTASPASFSVPPGGVRMVTVLFTPSSESDFFGTLTIESNDPSSPEATLTVTGSGLPAPVLGVEPTALTSSLAIGGRETQTLIISNAGESDLSFATATRTTAPATFLSVTPGSGTVPAHGSMSLAIGFDTAGLAASTYIAAIDITSNDPRATSFTVPASLTVIGLPDIAVSGDPVTLSSTLDYTVAGATTVHHLVLPSPPAGAGSVTLIAEGNYGDASAIATASAEGIALGEAGDAGSDCEPVTGVFPVSVSDLAVIVADGAADVTVRNSIAVEATCAVNRHTVRLSYRRRADLLDFGRTYPGYGTERTVLIENRGSAPLAITSIATDRPEFAVAAGPLSIPPGGSATLTVTLTPPAAGPMAGHLRIDSDDADTPTITVALEGLAVLPPVAGVSPLSLVAALKSHGSATRSLHVTNTGGSDLAWSLGAQGPGPGTPLPSWITASPSSGTIPAGGSRDVAVTLDAAHLVDGGYAQTISVYSNDPSRGRLDVSVSVHVGATALTSLAVDPATLNLSSNGRTISATLQLPSAYDPHQVVVSSVLLNGILAPNPSPISYTDVNGDGVLELALKFDRAAFEAIIPEGQSVPVTLEGEVRDQTWFRGTTTIRVIRPRVTAPNGGEYVAAGQALTIAWSPAPISGGVSYTIILSRDDGSTWETIATNLSGLSYAWSASGAATSRARVRVLASDAAGVMGYDTSDAGFTIAAALAPPHGVSTLRAQPGPGGTLLLTWSRPGVDSSHGPAALYRILRATSAHGSFVEIGTPAVESFTDPAAGGPGALYYKAVAVNAAGESSD